MAIFGISMNRDKQADKIPLTLAEARRMALRSQGLGDDAAPFGVGKAAVLQAIQHLGYVQVDTISVIQRAHHHVLWSRVPDYQISMLRELHDPEREVFEYWSHAASYMPTRDFRYSLPLMKKYRGEMHWADESLKLKPSMTRVLRHIRKHGALLLRNIESKEAAYGWTNAPPGKIERRALHELWMQGRVMIRSRQEFQKVFDLPERVLPQGLDTSMPNRREAAEFHVRRAFKALGIVRISELHYLQDAKRATQVRMALKRFIKSGEVVEVQIAEVPGVPCYALPEALKLKEPFLRHRCFFLSPFDNLVIQRDRLRWLFGFDYTLECYVPEPKRRFGYFVLPILWGERFIGRMDAKADRRARHLRIHRLFFEEHFADFKAAAPVVRESLEAFRRFQDCDTLEIAQVIPEKASRFLQ